MKNDGLTKGVEAFLKIKEFCEDLKKDKVSEQKFKETIDVAKGKGKTKFLSNYWQIMNIYYRGK